MISLVFTISLKGNKAASSHVSIYAALRSRDKAIPLGLRELLSDSKSPTSSDTTLHIRQLPTVLPFLVLPHLVKQHKLRAWNFRCLILNIMHRSSSSQPPRKEAFCSH